MGDTDGVAMAGAELVDFRKSVRAITSQNGGGKGAGFDRSGQTKDFEDVIEGNIFACKTDKLFERRFGVPKTALCLAGEEDKGFIRNFDFFRFGNFLEVGADQGIGNTAQIEALAAGENRGGKFLHLRCGEDKLYVRGRFFKGFEKGIEGLGCEHMDFVDDIDFEFSTGWGVGNAFPEFLDAFNAPVGGTVDLKYIEASTFLNFLTNIVIRIEIGFRSFGAVESFREDAGGGGFSYPAGPDKKKRMGKASL